jgi:hypothetical protein
MRLQIRLICGLLLALPGIGLAQTAGSGERPVRILAIVPALEPELRVALITRADVIFRSTMPGLIPMLISAGIQERRNAPLDARLHTTLAGFDLTQDFFKTLARSFWARSPLFEMTGSTDGARYLQGDELTSAVARDGYDYAIVFEPRLVGLTMATSPHESLDMSPAMSLKYRVLRPGSHRALSRNTATAYGLVKLPYQSAVASREFFTNAWPEMSLTLAHQITGKLYRHDVLHEMAASVGRGDEMPAVGTLLKRYERSFEWRLRPIRGWRDTKFDVNYVRVLEPKSDERLVIGLRLEVDLMLPEFGLAGGSLREYIQVFDERRRDELPDAEPLVAFEGIDAPGYEKYSYDVADGGRIITLFRKLDDQRVEIVRAIFLKDFAGIYARHRQNVEQMIATHQVLLR